MAYWRMRRIIAVAIVPLFILTSLTIAFNPPNRSDLRSTVESTWSEPVAITPQDQVFSGIDLEFGADGLYVLSFMYSYGPVLLFRSVDGGSTWSEKDVHGFPIEYGESGMCAYRKNDADTILVASGPSLVAQSTDGGTTFETHSYLPTTFGVWRLTDIGNNASWLGTSDDSRVYVVGCTRASGYYAVTATKSMDGGTTWSDPILVTDGSSDAVWPKVFSDGERLYTIYIQYPGARYVDPGEMMIQYSEDWGDTWSDPQLLTERTQGNRFPIVHSIQYIDEARALVTLSEYGSPENVEDNMCGRYGYLWFDDLSYEDVGVLSGPDWDLDDGFAGKIDDEGTFIVSWFKNNIHPSRWIMFTTSTDYGNGGATIIWKGTVVKKGSLLSSVVVLEFEPAADGKLSIKVYNNGLKFLCLAVVDVGEVTQLILVQPLAMMTSPDYPYGSFAFDSVLLSQGHSYLIVLMPIGPASTWADVTALFR